MSDYLDRLPSQEKETIRKRLRSPEAYERLRENVKRPEDLERELERSEKLAGLHLAMESEPAVRESVRSAIEEDISEGGIERVLETGRASPEARVHVEQGKFTVAVDAHPETHEDALIVLPEGNVREKMPVKQNFSERYAGQFGRQR